MKRTVTHSKMLVHSLQSYNKNTECFTLPWLLIFPCKNQANAHTLIKCATDIHWFMRSMMNLQEELQVVAISTVVTWYACCFTAFAAY